jgi:hypothetical protein
LQTTRPTLAPYLVEAVFLLSAPCSRVRQPVTFLVQQPGTWNKHMVSAHTTTINKLWYPYLSSNPEIPPPKNYPLYEPKLEKGNDSLPRGSHQGHIQSNIELTSTFERNAIPFRRPPRQTRAQYKQDTEPPHRQCNPKKKNARGKSAKKEKLPATKSISKQ